MTSDDPQLDLNVLPTVHEVFRAAHERREWTRLHSHRMEMLLTRVRYLRNAEYDPALAKRVDEFTKGYSKMYKSELIRVILYTEWEIEHFEKTGKVTIGHWKEK